MTIYTRSNDSNSVQGQVCIGDEKLRSTPLNNNGVANDTVWSINISRYVQTEEIKMPVDLTTCTMPFLKYLCIRPLARTRTCMLE